MSEILIIGGAGYIGSHVMLELLNNNEKVVVLDDLSTGSKQAMLGGVFYQGCMSDETLLNEIFINHDISIVMLLAGCIDVNESVQNPSKYYSNNVSKTLVLLDVMIKHNILKIIFSSTASIYDSNNDSTISIGSIENPKNPYAKSKLIIENVLTDYESAYGLKHVIFRYFNAAGADPEGRIGFHEPVTHLIPLALKAASGRRESLSIFGSDYQTRDGTCIRDYVHVMDLASAHYLALNEIIKTNESSLYNLGNGNGYSVKEVAKISQQVTNINFKIKTESRRVGDPVNVVADASHAKKILGWSPKYDTLEEIIKHSWQWEQNKSWHI